MGAFALSRAKNGSVSICHSESGEVMHPGQDPMIEAQSLYVEQSQVVSRFENLKEGEELVLWDVGLGAAFNAMAVIHSLKEKTSRGTLKIISFEKDMDALRLALFHPAEFVHLRHKAPHDLLEKSSYNDEKIRWQLIEGDFLETFKEAPLPDLIFFDPFSSKTDSELWSLQTFKKLFSFINSKNCSLYNYTASTVIRARLILAGFFVAHGKASPPKQETTVAHTKKDPNKQNLLGEEWLEKLERSDAKNLIYANQDWSIIQKQLKSHSQFLE
jgi:queuine tRNA-ribosyltransferase